MAAITLEELLAAKEERALRRERMQEEYPGTCVSLSVNIPGVEKDSPRIRALFRHALERIENALSVVTVQTVYGKAGPHAVLAVEGDAPSIKEVACILETENGYGRLLDIDVYDASGAAVSSPSRGPGRCCFVCDSLAVACMREGRHSLFDIMAGVERLFTAFHAAMSRAISESAAYLHLSGWRPCCTRQLLPRRRDSLTLSMPGRTTTWISSPFSAVQPLCLLGWHAVPRQASGTRERREVCSLSCAE